MSGSARQPAMPCPACGSGDLALQPRSNLGGTGHQEALQTEMLGCAIIYKYLVCRRCDRVITRQEYQAFLAARGL